MRSLVALRQRSDFVQADGANFANGSKAFLLGETLRLRPLVPSQCLAGARSFATAEAFLAQEYCPRFGFWLDFVLAKHNDKHNEEEHQKARYF